MTQTFTAKTIEDAKNLASKYFGVDQSAIEFEILEEPKKGFFGIGKKDEAKIQATYNPPAVPESVSENATSETAPETMSENATPFETAPETMSENATSSETAPETMSENATPSETAPETMSENATSFETAPETMSENATPSETAPETMSKNATPEKTPLQPDEDLITGEPSESALAKIEKAKAYLLSVLEAMEIQAELKVQAGSNSAIIEIITPNSGAIIGKRGETLDSLQYLTFMTANRSDKDYYRIILNTANYRERRRKTLEELAVKIAKNVLRSHRSTTLEPMNPYERRIIHSAIANIEGVSSKSIGEDPHRKVVISSDEKPPKSGRRRPPRDKNDRNHKRDSKRRNSDATPSRISMDSMKTSFEKDYKRPKPEDDINAGLYGKIEF